MTVSDKSSDQLVASIRKTKSAAESGVKKPAAKKTVKKKVVRAKTASAASSKVKQSPGAYQSVGRVWPD